MKYQAPALEKGLEILEYLSSHGEGATQKEIAHAMGRSPNEIYRMLMCLDERGYIRKDPVSGQFDMTLKLYSLRHGPSPVERLRETARPILKTLSHSTYQLSHITVFYEDELMIIAPTASPGPISVVMEEGRTYPLMATTSGRTLLAQCSLEERLDRLTRLEEYQKANGHDQILARTMLDEINRKGYIVRKSALTEGITDIAVIIGDDNTPLKASLSLVCMNSELNRKMSTEELIEAIKIAANEIARSLGIGERIYHT